MLTGILFFFFSMTAFLIFTEVVKINIFYSVDKKIVEFNFTLFALVFEDNKEKNVSDKKRGKKRSRKRKLNISFSYIQRLISLFIKKSEIKIKNLNAVFPLDEPDKNYIRYGLYNSILSSIYIFAENNAKKFEANNIIISYTEHTKTKISLDMHLKISLLNLLIIFMDFTFESMKTYKRKKVYNNVGK